MNDSKRCKMQPGWRAQERKRNSGLECEREKAKEMRDNTHTHTLARTQLEQLATGFGLCDVEKDIGQVLEVALWNKQAREE
jgi:hypothetical protein